jgi:serine/threonine protein kinase
MSATSSGGQPETHVAVTLPAGEVDDRFLHCTNCSLQWKRNDPDGREQQDVRSAAEPEITASMAALTLQADETDERYYPCCGASVLPWRHPDADNSISRRGNCSNCELPVSDGKLQVASLGPAQTNLCSFYPFLKEEPLDQGRFTKVQKLADGINGTVLLYRMRAGDGALDLPVVIKDMTRQQVDGSRAPEPCDRDAFYSRRRLPLEDAANEMAILSFLKRYTPPCPYLLRLYAIYTDISRYWLATEFCSDGELFNIVTTGTIDEVLVRRYVWQLLQAVHHLHSHNIGHRDISLENLVVKRTGEIRADGSKGTILNLMDFGQGCALHAWDASRTELRYFRKAGKSYYAPPEMYLPRRAGLATCPAGGAGRIVTVNAGGGVYDVQFPEDAVEGQSYACEPIGYVVAPADMFACGVCLFILHTQNPPWKFALPSDPSFAYIARSGVDKLLQAWKKPLLNDHAMQLLQNLLLVDPRQRCKVAEALGKSWFADLGGPGDVPVPATVASSFDAASAVPAAAQLQHSASAS